MITQKSDKQRKQFGSIDKLVGTVGNTRKSKYKKLTNM